MLVREKMNEISALEMLLPLLTDKKIFSASGKAHLPDLFKFNQNVNESYILNPTCEEIISELLASYTQMSYKNLPCRFYQISSKFRDEKRPKYGLLRSKEFIMKDLYCFDSTFESSMMTYEEVKNKYKEFFNNLGIPYVVVKGTEGDIGGLKSDEFYFMADVGDNNLVLCQKCGHKECIEFVKLNDQVCSNCQNGDVKIFKGIEVRIFERELNFI